MNPTTTVVCISGSTRFRDEIAAARAKLTLSGEIVVGPEMLVRSDPAYADLHDSEQKVMLDELHLRKIDLATYVYVVNPGGYIGDSTRREIEYALSNGKPVQYLEAPADAGADEIPADVFETIHDEHTRFPFFETEDAVIIGSGHHDKTEFAALVTQYDNLMSGEQYETMPSDVEWRYAIPSREADEWCFTWAQDGEPTAADKAGAIAITMVRR